MTLNTSKGRWLVISEDIFVDHIDECMILLYNTKNGKYIVTQDSLLIKIINLLYQPRNLGAISSDIINTEITSDVRLALETGVIYLSDSAEGKKPIVLLPILNLQYDIQKDDKYGIEGRLLSMGAKTRFISGAKIRLSSLHIDFPSEKSDYRNIAARQNSCPSYDNSEDIMALETLGTILDKLQRTSTLSVDLICTSTYFEKIPIGAFIDELRKYPFNFRIHMYTEDFENASIMEGVTKESVNVGFVLYNDCYSKCYEENVKVYNSKIKNVSLIYKESDIPTQHNSSMIPVWTGANIDLFKRYVWLNLSDIEKSAVSFNTIFRNQKLNSNFFGIIDIDVRGNVYAHGSKTIISNVMEQGFSLANVVASEMMDNKSWRLTRDLTNCRKCPLRYICPPVSKTELESNEIRMCNINLNTHTI